MILQDFADWHEKIAPEIQHVSKILGTRLTAAPEELIQEAIEAEAWGARIGELLSEANSFLDKASFALKPPSSSGTAFDREIELDALVAPVRACRDVLESLGDSLKQRLSFSQSALKYMTVNSSIRT